MNDGAGLRIGELAALAGVSTRAVRHYHRAGALPEPARRANGYRVYGLLDVVRLLRVRNLLDLGLSLAEAGAVLGDPTSGEVRGLLTDVVEDLAERERRLRRRRERLESLLAAGDDPTRSAELHELRSGLGPEPAGAREALVAELLEHTTEQAPTILRAQRAGLDDPDRAGLMARFEALAGRPPHDPAVDELAHAAAGHGDRLLAGLTDAERATLPADGDPVAAARLEQAVTADLDPAQARCVRLMFALIRERTT